MKIFILFSLPISLTILSCNPESPGKSDLEGTTYLFTELEKGNTFYYQFTSAGFELVNTPSDSIW